MVTVGGGGGGEKVKGGGGEGDVRRSLSRQHAKDISEYTKQLLTKDRELESLRISLAKVCHFPKTLHVQIDYSL